MGSIKKRREFDTLAPYCSHEGPSVRVSALGLGVLAMLPVDVMVLACICLLGSSQVVKCCKWSYQSPNIGHNNYSYPTYYHSYITTHEPPSRGVSM